MNVLVLTMFISLILAGAGVGFFIWTTRQGAHEHSDRMALLPLDNDPTNLTDLEEH